MLVVDIASSSRCISTFIKIVVVLTALFPGSTSAKADSAAEHFNKGKALYKEKRYDAALEELEAARKLAPEDDTILNWIGWIDLSQNRFTEARGPLEHAVKIRPN